MIKSEVATSCYDYLLLEIIRNRKKESDTNEEAKEKLKQLGSILGNKLAEDRNLKDGRLTINGVLNDIIKSNWCHYFFSNSSISPNDNNAKKYYLNIPQCDFISNISSFSESTEETNEMKELYLTFICSLIQGCSNSRGFKIGINYNKPNKSDDKIQITIVPSN